MLIPVVMSKLPSEIKLVITRQFGKDVWEVKLVLEAYRKELEAREKVVLSDNASEISNCSGSALHVLSFDAKKKFCCVFCDGQHKPQYCRIFTNQGHLR